MIINFSSAVKAQTRFNKIRKKYEEEANRSEGVGTKSCLGVKYFPAKNLLTAIFNKYTGNLQLMGNAIEIWVNADLGIDDVYTAENIFKFMSMYKGENHD